MPVTYKKIASVTVGASGASDIEFTSIPGTYTDLIVKLSLRSNESGGTAQSTAFTMNINGASTNRTWRNILAFSGTSVASDNGSNANISAIPGTSVTASTFNNVEIYIPNYAGSTNKSFSLDSATENNSATNNELRLQANLWSQTAAITALRFLPLATTSFVQYSTATLYGISKS